MEVQNGQIKTEIYSIGENEKNILKNIGDDMYIYRYYQYIFTK